MFAGSVENQYLVGASSPSGHSPIEQISTHRHMLKQAGFLENIADAALVRRKKFSSLIVKSLVAGFSTTTTAMIDLRRIM